MLTHRYLSGDGRAIYIIGELMDQGRCKVSRSQPYSMTYQYAEEILPVLRLGEQYDGHV